MLTVMQVTILENAALLEKTVAEGRWLTFALSDVKDLSLVSYEEVPVEVGIFRCLS